MTFFVPVWKRFCIENKLKTLFMTNVLLNVLLFQYYIIKPLAIYSSFLSARSALVEHPPFMTVKSLVIKKAYIQKSCKHGFFCELFYVLLNDTPNPPPPIYPKFCWFWCDKPLLIILLRIQIDVTVNFIVIISNVSLMDLRIN